MINQTSIKYISGLLENPQTLTDGDQSSIALFRQTFPYFVPARYLVALEAHKKSAHAKGMYTAIQPFLGDWMLFCDFLEASNKKVEVLSEVSKVVDKKKAEVQEQLAKPVAEAEKPVTILTERISEAVKQYEVQPAAEVAAAAIEPVRDEVKEIVATEELPKIIPVADVISKAEELLPPADLVEDILPVQDKTEELVPDIEMPRVVEVQDEPLLHDMPVAFVAEPAATMKVEIPAVEEIVAVVPEATEQAKEEVVVAASETAREPIIEEPEAAVIVVPEQDEAELISVVSMPVEVAVFDTVPVAPVPVVIAEEQEEEETVAAEPLPETADVITVAETEVAADEPVTIFPQDPETTGGTEVNGAVESGFAKAWAEMEARDAEVHEDKPIGITHDAEPAITFTETGEEEHDPLIFPIYTKDYFLQQGEKVSEEIPLEINELRDAGNMSEEDKSLMVVMSFSEWLMHFKSTSERQREETKDQKALKTMWQKEKLAAAIEEENEEIPETVFEMAVNSISKEDGLVSESLADIYIKQGKYDRAIEMYRKLSLRNPQKSAYFARKIEEALKDKQS